VNEKTCTMTRQKPEGTVHNIGNFPEAVETFKDIEEYIGGGRAGHKIEKLSTVKTKKFNSLYQSKTKVKAKCSERIYQTSVRWKKLLYKYGDYEVFETNRGVMTFNKGELFNFSKDKIHSHKMSNFQGLFFYALKNKAIYSYRILEEKSDFYKKTLDGKLQMLKIAFKYYAFGEIDSKVIRKVKMMCNRYCRKAVEFLVVNIGFRSERMDISTFANLADKKYCEDNYKKKHVKPINDFEGSDFFVKAFNIPRSHVMTISTSKGTMVITDKSLFVDENVDSEVKMYVVAWENHIHIINHEKVANMTLIRRSDSAKTQRNYCL